MKERLMPLSWRMVTLAVILPLNLAILVFVLFMQVWFFQTTIEKDGLTARRFLWKDLIKIVQSDSPETVTVPSWISLVIMEDGTIYYPEEDVIRGLLRDWSTSTSEERVDSFLTLARAALEVELDMTIARFSYRGKRGICYYIDDRFPGHMRVLGNRKYMINLFIVTTLLFQLGGIIMYNLRRNMKELIKATERLRNKDFTTPLQFCGKKELSPLFNAFEDMRKELNRTSSQAALTLLSITHDLKTPLTSIRGYLEAFRDGVIDEDDNVDEIIESMLKKANLLDGRISELLDHARIFNSGFERPNEPVEVISWIAELDSYCFEEAKLYRREYRSSIQIPDGTRVQGDEQRLSRAVTNLFDNALRYTAEGDLIRFSSTVGDGSLILSVDDSGPGVPEEERGSVFELFFRKDKGRNSRGMGIGLASVQFIVEFHGGRVRCLDSELGGACFEITLPLMEE